MKQRMRERMKKRRAKFVVGYIGAGNVVFGMHSTLLSDSPRQFINDCAKPGTLRQAKKLLALMPCADCAIFELVPIEVNR